MENTNNNPTAKELRKVCAAAWQVISKSDTDVHRTVLGNGWTFKAEGSYNRGGKTAWSPRYYLISPTGKTFGGYESANGFCGYFGNPYGWQWVDDYKGNGFKKAGA